LNYQRYKWYRKKNVVIYHQKATKLVETQIEWVEKQILAEKHLPPSQITSSGKLVWTGTVIEWVEMIYALYLVKRINKGEITLKELFRRMGEIFDFEVKEFANYFMNIKNRKDEHRTKFTDLMRNSVLERMEEADRKPSR
jgi:hypothetical protein